METMDLNQFDLVHSGVSGGKDSADLFFWLIYESGIPITKRRGGWWHDMAIDDLDMIPASACDIGGMCE